MIAISEERSRNSGGFKALVDVLIEPKQGLEMVWTGAPVLLPIVLLLLCFCVGSALQSRALHNVQAVTLQQSLGVDSESLTQSQQQAIAATRNAPISRDMPNWAIGFFAVLIVLALAAVLAAVTVMIGGGELRMARIFSATMYIAVPTLGLYLVLSGFLIGIQDPEHFDTYASLAPRVPSISFVLPFVSSAFWRAFWGAINPFSAWAVFLYFVLFTKVANVNRPAAMAGAASIVSLGAVLQGLVAMIST